MGRAVSYFSPFSPSAVSPHDMQPRTRFNAKARQGSSYKKRAKRGKDTIPPSQEQVDPNALIVVPRSELETEDEKKRKMREEVSDVCISLLAALKNEWM